MSSIRFSSFALTLTWFLNILLMVLCTLFFTITINAKQFTIDDQGVTYTVIEASNEYYVINSTKKMKLSVNKNDAVHIQNSCKNITEAISVRRNIFKLCQKVSITKENERSCSRYKIALQGLIWDTFSTDEIGKRYIRLDTIDSFLTQNEEQHLKEKIASYLNIRRDQVTVLSHFEDHYNDIAWNYITVKENLDFELLKNFYTFADFFPQKIPSVPTGVKIFDNITRCSLLMHEAELVADVEYKIQTPGPIDERIKENLENLLAVFKEIHMDTTIFSIKKFIVIGAYIGHTFQESLDLRHDRNENTILNIFWSLFDSELELQKTVDYKTYRKRMDIKPVEVIVPGKLRAVAPE